MSSKADRLDFKVANRTSCFVICSEFEPDPSEEKSNYIHGKQILLASMRNALPTPVHLLKPDSDVVTSRKRPPTVPPQPRQNSRPHFLSYHSTLHVVRIMFITHYIGLDKKFIWVSDSILWKDLNELFGQPNTSWSLFPFPTRSEGTGFLLPQNQEARS